jgi:2,3-bisphosphoglycerate-dependent phosphoglycerate mutase
LRVAFLDHRLLRLAPVPRQQTNDGNYYRYRKLTAEQLDRSRAESLKDAADRIMPFWKSVVVPSIRAGNKCLVVSHANTIRTLIKHIDQISDEDIKGMTIPTGIPLLYRLDKNLKPVDPQVEMEFRYMVEPKGYVRLNAAASFSLGIGVAC